MSRQIETVAIIGGGPSGSTLACRLAMRGVPARARPAPGSRPARADRRGWIAAHRHLKSWMELIECYYDGRMFAMNHTGMGWKRRFDTALSHTVHRYVESHIACMASGATTSSRYSRGFIQFMAHHGIQGVDPDALAIR